MSYLPFSSRAVEAGDALQSAKKAALPQALSTPPGGVERTILVRLLAVGNSPRSDAVRRGKRLVGKGLLVARPEAIADLLLSEGAPEKI